MFVYNDCRTDARVLREAASLVAAGHEVTIMARPSNAASQDIEREQRDGFEIVRVPIPKRNKRTWTWIRSPWRTKGWVARWILFRWRSALRRFPRGLINALLATLFGLVMLPWAVIQRDPPGDLRVARSGARSGCGHDRLAGSLADHDPCLGA